MSEDNEILAEIRRVREDMARESGYNVHSMFEKWRAGTARLEQEGWTIVRPEPAAARAVLREEPPA